MKTLYSKQGLWKKVIYLGPDPREGRNRGGGEPMKKDQNLKFKGATERRGFSH